MLSVGGSSVNAGYSTQLFFDSSGKYTDPAETLAMMMRLEENFGWSPHLVRSLEFWLLYSRTSDAPHPGFIHLLSKITPSITHVQTLKIYGADIRSKDESNIDWTLIRGAWIPINREWDCHRETAGKGMPTTFGNKGNPHVSVDSILGPMPGGGCDAL